MSDIIKFKKRKIYNKNRVKRRIITFGLLFSICLTGLFSVIFYYQYVKGAQYERASLRQMLNRNSINRETIPGRGLVLDRNRQPLAASLRVYTVFLDVTMLDVRNAETKAKSLQALSEAFENISLRELEALFAKNAEGDLIKPTNYYVINRQVPGEIAIQLAQFSDIYIEDDTLRKYTDPYLAPQVIGFLRGDSVWGLESYYNTELLGERGRLYRTYDQDNNPVTREIQAVDGYYLITTLDGGIQRIAQSIAEEYAARFECEFAGMLVMDPYTGEILAMAQTPSFSLDEPDNPVLYTGSGIHSLWDTLTSEDRLNQMYKVWKNYHITRTFEPGSIFKPVVVAAALEENLIKPRDTFYCEGSKTISGKTIPCWHRGHGVQYVPEVIRNSCNVGMIEIIGKLGRYTFFQYRNDFGFGEKTGIDLFGEESVSHRSVMYPLSELNPVELATSAIGQGFNNTTIQAISAFAAVINGGNLMKPYLVSQIVDENGTVIKENTPVILRKTISKETSDYMRLEMQRVVSPEGTGRNAAIEGYTIGGKTGSAQQGPRDENQRLTLSFIAYTPVENPKYIILAVLDTVKDQELSSSASVAYMIKDALTEIFEYKNIRPSDGQNADLRFLEPNRDVMDNYSGMHLSEVTRSLNNLDIDYLINYTGTVVKYHVPAAGRPVPNTPVYLYMDTNSRTNDMVDVPNVTGLSLSQAKFAIMESFLIPVERIDDANTDNHSDSGGPATYNPIDAIPKNKDEPYYEVYKQYPEPGVTVEKGTQIRLRIRPLK